MLSDVKGDDVMARARMLLWKTKEIKVRFLNEDQNISEEEILQIANEWHECNTDVVPRFVPCNKEDSGDIRIKFIGMHNCLGGNS